MHNKTERIASTLNCSVEFVCHRIEVNFVKTLTVEFMQLTVMNGAPVYIQRTCAAGFYDQL